MKKRFFILFLALPFLVLPFLVLSCTQEDLPEPQPAGKTLTISATLAAETDDPNTKISLEQDNLNIKPRWEEGDYIGLCVVANEQAYTQTVNVDIDPKNNKKASFTFTLPTGDYPTFDLYGLYGGDGFQENSTLVKLPDNPVADTEAGIRKAMVLTFAKKNINVSSPDFSVNFSHLGSVFKILVSNTDAANFTTISGISRAVLASNSADPLGLHVNTDKSSGRYNVATGDFTETTSIAELSFVLPGVINLKPGDSQEFWGWFIPKEDTNWPELKLKLLDASDNVLLTTTGIKEAKPSPPVSGKAYHFFAEYNNNSFTFSSLIKGKFTDPRDGNVYKTVKIGDKIVMAENLRYLPKVMARKTESKEDSCYYVYGFGNKNTDEGELDVEAAKDTVTYKIYGVLYNWPAAMGACPDGWHLPSYPEFKDIIEKLEFGTSNTNRGSSFKSIGNTTNGFGLWTDDNTNATNISGFTALPAGRKKGGTGPSAFADSKEFSFFYSSSRFSEEEKDKDRIRTYQLRGDNESITLGECVRNAANSVRCVKNY
jgi:uncharacterized protein (TIGR02145 family)